MVDVEKGNPANVEDNDHEEDSSVEHGEKSSTLVDVEEGNPVDVENNDPREDRKEPSMGPPQGESSTSIDGQNNDPKGQERRPPPLVNVKSNGAVIELRDGDWGKTNPQSMNA